MLRFFRSVLIFVGWHGFMLPRTVSGLTLSLERFKANTEHGDTSTVTNPNVDDSMVGNDSQENPPLQTEVPEIPSDTQPGTTTTFLSTALIDNSVSSELSDLNSPLSSLPPPPHLGPRHSPSWTAQTQLQAELVYRLNKFANLKRETRTSSIDNFVDVDVLTAPIEDTEDWLQDNLRRGMLPDLPGERGDNHADEDEDNYDGVKKFKQLSEWREKDGPHSIVKKDVVVNSGKYNHLYDSKGGRVGNRELNLFDYDGADNVKFTKNNTTNCLSSAGPSKGPSEDIVTNGSEEIPVTVDHTAGVQILKSFRWSSCNEYSTGISVAASHGFMNILRMLVENPYGNPYGANGCTLTPGTSKFKADLNYLLSDSISHSYNDGTTGPIWSAARGEEIEALLYLLRKEREQNLRTEVGVNSGGFDRKFFPKDQSYMEKLRDFDVNAWRNEKVFMHGGGFSDMKDSVKNRYWDGRRNSDLVAARALMRLISILRLRRANSENGDMVTVGGNPKANNDTDSEIYGGVTSTGEGYFTRADLDEMLRKEKSVGGTQTETVTGGGETETATVILSLRPEDVPVPSDSDTDLDPETPTDLNDLNNDNNEPTTDAPNADNTELKAAVADVRTSLLLDENNDLAKEITTRLPLFFATLSELDWSCDGPDTDNHTPVGSTHSLIGFGTEAGRAEDILTQAYKIASYRSNGLRRVNGQGENVVLAMARNSRLENDSSTSPKSEESEDPRLPILRILAQFGADLNFRNQKNYQETPLMRACEWNYRNYALELIALGADPNLRRPDGKSAADVAELHGFVGLAEEVRGFMSSPGAGVEQPSELRGSLSGYGFVPAVVSPRTSLLAHTQARIRSNSPIKYLPEIIDGQNNVVVGTPHDSRKRSKDDKISGISGPGNLNAEGSTTKSTAGPTGDNDSEVSKETNPVKTLGLDSEKIRRRSKSPNNPTLSASLLGPIDETQDWARQLPSLPGFGEPVEDREPVVGCCGDFDFGGVSSTNLNDYDIRGLIPNSEVRPPGFGLPAGGGRFNTAFGLAPPRTTGNNEGASSAPSFHHSVPERPKKVKPNSVKKKRRSRNDEDSDDDDDNASTTAVKNFPLSGKSKSKVSSLADYSQGVWKKLEKTHGFDAATATYKEGFGPNKETKKEGFALNTVTATEKEGFGPGPSDYHNGSNNIEPDNHTKEIESKEGATKDVTAVATVMEEEAATGGEETQEQSETQSRENSKL